MRIYALNSNKSYNNFIIPFQKEQKFLSYSAPNFLFYLSIFLLYFYKVQQAFMHKSIS